MIKNYKLFKESLLNKMTGYSEEDIKNNFLNGEIEYRKYLELCDENGWEKPSYNVAYKLFKDAKINALDFFSECKNNDWKIPSDEELFKSLNPLSSRYTIQFLILTLFKFIYNGSYVSSNGRLICSDLLF